MLRARGLHRARREAADSAKTLNLPEVERVPIPPPISRCCLFVQPRPTVEITDICDELDRAKGVASKVMARIS